MPNTQAPLVAGGNVYPNRFIKISADHTGIQSGANEVCDGISCEGSSIIPISGMTTPTYLATEGQPLPIYDEGDICLVEAGGVITAGAQLKSDSVGRAVAAATTGTTAQNIGAKALENATAAGEKIRVKCSPRRTVRPAIA